MYTQDGGEIRVQRVDRDGAIRTIAGDRIGMIAAIQGPPGEGFRPKGTVANSGALPAGVTGDAYTTLDDNHLWVYTGTNWVDMGPLASPPLPAGNSPGDLLEWDGTDWLPQGLINIDTTAGTKITIGGHVVYYASGLRAITTWDASGNVTGDPMPARIDPGPGNAGGIWFYRVNNRCTVRMVGAQANNVQPQVDVPVGFRAVFPYPTGSFYYRDGAVSKIGACQIGSSKIFMTVDSATTYLPRDDNTYALEISWDTTAAYPTSLPGTPG